MTENIATETTMLSVDAPASVTPESSGAASKPLPAATAGSQLTPEMKLELAALRCIAHYGGVAEVRAALTERAKENPGLDDTLKFFNAWHAIELPKYWQGYSADNTVWGTNAPSTQ